MVWFIVSALALGGAIALFFVSRSLAAKVLDIAGTETSSAASLTELAASVAKEIGAGSFAQKAEVKGRAVSLEPLRADFSGAEVVWYDCEVTREWEEEYWETDSNGNRQRKTRRGSEQVSSVLRNPPFALEDATGRISVDPRGARIEGEKTWSSFEQGGGGAPLRVGSFLFNSFAPAAGGRRTLGYRFEEKSIPVGRELYVFGEASDSGGSLRIKEPEKGRFIVSPRGEEAILKGARSGVLWTRVSALVLVLGAAAALVVALLAPG